MEWITVNCMDTVEFKVTAHAPIIVVGSIKIAMPILVIGDLFKIIVSGPEQMPDTAFT